MHRACSHEVPLPVDPVPAIIGGYPACVGWKCSWLPSVYQFFCGKEKTAMADAGSGAADYPVLVITFIVGATVFVLVYISSLLKSAKGGDGSKSAEAEVLKKEKQRDISSSNLKSSKKKHSEKWVRDSKHSFSHPWLLTSLKGHSGEVLDMDFSSNGKFLATCAEVRDSRTVDCIINFRDFDPVVELCKERTSKVFHSMLEGQNLQSLYCALLFVTCVGGFRLFGGTCCLHI